MHTNEPLPGGTPSQPTVRPESAIFGFGESPMKLIVTLERNEAGWIVAECPSIPGCVSQGKTEEEALTNIREAIQGCLEVRAAQGLPLTLRTVEIDVSIA